jgi:hypothetical protein
MYKHFAVYKVMFLVYRVNTTERLEMLRKEMFKEGLAAYIILLDEESRLGKQLYHLMHLEESFPLIEMDLRKCSCP